MGIIMGIIYRCDRCGLKESNFKGDQPIAIKDTGYDMFLCVDCKKKFNSEKDALYKKQSEEFHKWKKAFLSEGKK